MNEIERARIVLKKQMLLIEAKEAKLDKRLEEATVAKIAYKIRMAELRKDEAFIEREKAIMRQQKADLDVRQGKINALEKMLY